MARELDISIPRVDYKQETQDFLLTYDHDDDDAEEEEEEEDVETLLAYPKP